MNGNTQLPQVVLLVGGAAVDDDVEGVVDTVEGVVVELDGALVVPTEVDAGQVTRSGIFWFSQSVK